MQINDRRIYQLKLHDLLVRSRIELVAPVLGLDKDRQIFSRSHGGVSNRDTPYEISIELLRSRYLSLDFSPPSPDAESFNLCAK